MATSALSVLFISVLQWRCGDSSRGGVIAAGADVNISATVLASDVSCYVTPELWSPGRLTMLTMLTLVKDPDVMLL